MVTFQNQAVIVKEPACGRGGGLKMETARISCAQEQVEQLQIHPFSAV
jgi:hypothetical protein